MIYGVVGIIIWTENLNRLASFYRDILGLAPHSVHDDFITFDFNGMRLNLGYHSQVKGGAKEPYRIMVNLGTKSIYSCYQTLTNKGVEFVRPPELEKWGGYVATFKDPDGNLIQLLQLPEEPQ